MDVQPMSAADKAEFLAFVAEDRPESWRPFPRTDDTPREGEGNHTPDGSGRLPTSVMRSAIHHLIEVDAAGSRGHHHG